MLRVSIASLALGEVPLRSGGEDIDPVSRPAINFKLQGKRRSAEVDTRKLVITYPRPDATRVGVAAVLVAFDSCHQVGQHENAAIMAIRLLRGRLVDAEEVSRYKKRGRRRGSRGSNASVAGWKGGEREKLSTPAGSNWNTPDDGNSEN